MKSIFAVVALLVLIACGGTQRQMQVSPSSHVTAVQSRNAQMPAESSNSMSLVRPHRPARYSAPLRGGYTTMPGFSLVPAAYGQVPEASPFVGSYNAFCNTTPLATWPQTPFGAAIFGMGRWKDSNCGAEGVITNTDGFTVAQNNLEGAPVIGGGTLQNLVVVAGAKSIMVNGESGKVIVYVVRDGQVLLPGITCTLGGQHRCLDMSTRLPVLDGDVIVGIVVMQPGDVLQQLRVFLGKS